jgi:hypothetical protein
MSDFLVRAGHERAADRLGIADAAYLYGAAVDILGNEPAPSSGTDTGLAKATAVFSQCLTHDAKLRLFLAGPRGPSSPLGPGGPTGVAIAVREYFRAYGYVGTQHNVGNVRVAFEGADRARGTCQIPCFHWLADERMLLAPVQYEDLYVRVDGVWKIEARDIFAMRFWVATGYAPDPLDPSLKQPAPP